MSQCTLCLALGDLKDRIENTPLLVTKNFVVLPALGPLAVGHVLVVSRSHLPSFAMLGRELLMEYEQLVHIARSLPVYAEQGLLEAEHGATALGSGGACIDHAHINWIPSHSDKSRMFDGELTQIRAITSLSDLAGLTEPYILMRASANDGLVYSGAAVQSQLIRRRICSLDEREDWDWAVVPGFKSVEATIELWHAERLHERF